MSGRFLSSQSSLKLRRRWPDAFVLVTGQRRGRDIRRFLVLPLPKIENRRDEGGENHDETNGCGDDE